MGSCSLVEGTGAQHTVEQRDNQRWREHKKGACNPSWSREKRQRMNRALKDEQEASTGEGREDLPLKGNAWMAVN